MEPTATTTTPLLVKGQGVFIFNHTNKDSPCVIRLLNADQTNGLKIEFTLDHVHVNDISTNEPLIDPTNISGLSSHNGAYYWFSLDSQNQRLYAGVGEARLETIIYSYL